MAAQALRGLLLSATASSGRSGIGDYAHAEDGMADLADTANGLYTGPPTIFTAWPQAVR